MTMSNRPVVQKAQTFLGRAKNSIVAVLRGDLGRLDRYFVFLLPLVFASFFLLSKTPQRTLIYLTCLLPMLLYLRPTVFRVVRREPVWWLATGLCALWIVSVAWSGEITTESVFDTVRIGLAVALFVHGGIWLALQRKLPQQRILNALLLTAAAMGTLTVTLALVPGTETASGRRLTGFGWAGHSGIGGDIYAFVGLIALVALTEARGNEPRRIVPLALLFGLCAFYAVLTESRGAVLALVAGALVCVALSRPKHVLTVIAAVGVAGIAAYAGGFVDFASWIDRGSSRRIGIWIDSLAKFAENPILGLGAADVTLLEVGSATFNSTHNIFIAMMVDLGALGLAVFLALTALAVWRAWLVFRAGRGALLLTLLAFSYTVMMLHTQTVLLMPAREWLIFWLPLLLLVQQYAVGRGDTAPKDRA